MVRSMCLPHQRGRFPSQQPVVSRPSPRLHGFWVIISIIAVVVRVRRVTLLSRGVSVCCPSLSSPDGRPPRLNTSKGKSYAHARLCLLNVVRREIPRTLMIAVRSQFRSSACLTCSSSIRCSNNCGSSGMYPRADVSTCSVNPHSPVSTSLSTICRSRDPTGLSSPINTQRRSRTDDTDKSAVNSAAISPVRAGPASARTRKISMSCGNSTL